MGNTLEPQTLLTCAAKYQETFIEHLQHIVNIDSGSFTKPGVDKVGSFLAGLFSNQGFDVSFHEEDEYGNHLTARIQGKGKGRVLCVGHMDTVFPEGEVEKRPFTVKDGRAYGPGVLDMKSGLLIAMLANQVLRDLGADGYESFTFFFNSDEEIGSPTSAKLVQRLAKESDIALIFEPGRENGNVILGRKGVGSFRLDVRGVAAHAGVEPEKGRSAISELAYKIRDLDAINGTIPGVTVNVGIIGGGERINIVAERAFAQIDLRVLDQNGAEQARQKIEEVAQHTYIDGTETVLSGKMWHGPFEPNEKNQAFFQILKEEAAKTGKEIRWGISGGGSDGNTTAAMGVPTVDGLGPDGEWCHNPDEYVDLSSVVPRIALVAAAINRYCGEM